MIDFESDENKCEKWSSFDHDELNVYNKEDFSRSPKGSSESENFREKNRFRGEKVKPKNIKDKSKYSYLISRYNLCDDIALILKDKINTDAIQLSSLEKKAIDKFITEFSHVNTPLNKKFNKNQAQPQKINKPCRLGDRCVVWLCKYNHPENRKEECECVNNSCKKLHRDQAICKNPNHDDDCKFAHKMIDLK